MLALVKTMLVYTQEYILDSEVYKNEHACSHPHWLFNHTI